MQRNRAAVDATIARNLPAPFRRAKNLVISRRDAPAGSAPSYFVRTPAKQVFQLGQEEHLLIQLLDGKRSFAEVQDEFKRQIGTELTNEQFEGFLTELLDCGIVEPDRPATPVGPANPSAPAAMRRTSAAGESVSTPKAAPTPEAAGMGAAPEIPSTLELDEDDFDKPATPRSRLVLRFFNPTAALRALDWLAGPIRYYVWLLVPVVLISLLMASLHTDGIGTSVLGLGLVPALIAAAAALAVVAVVPTTAQATMASFFGSESPVCGLGLRFGVLPYVRFSDEEWADLSGGPALWVTCGRLTTLLALFAFGTLTWLATKGTGGWLPGAALIGGQIALCAFLAAALPVGDTSGRRWLTTLLGDDSPWRSGGTSRAHLVALIALWALGAVGLAALYVSAAAHAGAFGAAGLAICPVLDPIVWPLLLIAPVVAWLWLRGAVASQSLTRVGYRPEDEAPTAPAPDLPAGFVLPFDREMGAGLGPRGRGAPADTWPTPKTVIFFATVLAIAMAVGFVPYFYEAGGNFTILPHDSSKLNARVAGELTEVLVNEGDWVVPGQIMGVLSDWDQQANLAVAKAQLENAKAALQTLYETPKPEDVELARKQYELALSKLPYDKVEFERASALIKTDAISRSNYDQILSQYQQDQAAVDVTRANYDSVRTGPTPAQFDAARALVRQYAASVAYNEDQLDRTRIRATGYGEVVTPNPMLMRGQWFDQGQLVFTVQDLRQVQADVQIPETDIAHVQIGGVARLRPWGFPETTFLGTAIAIAGDAQPDPGGSGSNIVRVRVEIPNPYGALHPTMTGFAKITGYYMPTWKAWLLMVIRFFTITIWSFVP